MKLGKYIDPSYDDLCDWKEPIFCEYKQEFCLKAPDCWLGSQAAKGRLNLQREM